MYIHIAIHVLLDVHPSFGGCGNRRDSPFRPLLLFTSRVNLFCKMHDAHICLFNIIGINEWVLACLRGTVYSMIKSETCVAWYDVQAMVIYIMMLKKWNIQVYVFLFLLEDDDELAALLFAGCLRLLLFSFAATTDAVSGISTDRDWRSAEFLCTAAKYSAFFTSLS